MILFLIISQLICNPIATTANLVSQMTGPIATDSFRATQESVRTYSDNHPQVMHAYQQYVDEIRVLQAKGEILEKDTARILDAVAFAAKKHHYQKRKNSQQIPYIIHPIGVSYILATLAEVRDANVLIAALLHDTVEDTKTTFAEIHAHFGPQIESYVRELTDDKSLPKEERKRLQIENAHHKSPGAALIKLSDKLYNLSDLSLDPPADWSQERVDQYFSWAKQVVNNLPPVNAALKQKLDEVIASH